MKTAGIVLAFFLVSAVSAQAAAPLMPSSSKEQLRSLLEQFDAQDLAYVPTKAPAHYLFIGFSANRGSTNFRLGDSRFPSSGFGQRSIFVSVDPFHGKLPACIKGFKQKLKTNGRTVYLRDDKAWRCVRSPRGRMLRIFAESAFVNAKQLGVLVGSFELVR